MAKAFKSLARSRQNISRIWSRLSSAEKSFRRHTVLTPRRSSELHSVRRRRRSVPAAPYSWNLHQYHILSLTWHNRFKETSCIIVNQPFTRRALLSKPYSPQENSFFVEQAREACCWDWCKMCLNRPLVAFSTFPFPCKMMLANQGSYQIRLMALTSLISNTPYPLPTSLCGWLTGFGIGRLTASIFSFLVRRLSHILIT